MSASIPMASPRTVALYDPASGVSWNENMSPGDFAIHYSSFLGGISAGQCTIVCGLREAEGFADDAVKQDPKLRCRIYGAEGFVGAPVREIRGAEYKGEGEISAKMRRWGGGGLLGVGLVLMAVDWASGFRLSWPALVGSRFLIPGAVLLITEALVMLNAKQKARQVRDQRA
jgi:hypothetical protein